MELMRPALSEFLRDLSGQAYINAAHVDNTGSHLGLTVRLGEVEMQLLVPAHAVTLVLSAKDETAIGFLA